MHDEHGPATRAAGLVHGHSAGAGVQLRRERGHVRHVRPMPAAGGRLRGQRRDPVKQLAERRGRRRGFGNLRAPQGEAGSSYLRGRKASSTVFLSCWKIE